MATNTPGTTARKLSTQQVHYLAKTISYTSPGGGVVGVLPAGSIIQRGITHVWTGFNDTTADDINVGIAGEADRYVSALDANAAASTAFDDLANANQRVTSDQKVLWAFNAAATGDGSTGEATIVIEYVLEE